MGPTSAKISAVALIELTSWIVNANNAGYFQRPSRSARIVKAVSQGSALPGPRSTLRRAEYSSAYGVKVNASIATGTPGPATESERNKYRTPKPAAHNNVPSHNRCVTHAGSPTT